MSVMVKALGYYSHKQGTRGLSKLKQHLKYLEHGKQHQNEPKGFDPERDDVTRRQFMGQMHEQPPRGVVAHKLVLSLSQDERDRHGIDMKHLVRDTMADFERATGRSLRWVAFEHDDPGHPHVHVVVAGYDNAGKQVGIYPKDLKDLAQLADRQLGRQAEWSRVTGLNRVERSEARGRPMRIPDPAERQPAGLLEQVRKVIRDLLSPSRGIERER
jgi:hypothetical protein